MWNAVLIAVWVRLINACITYFFKTAQKLSHWLTCARQTHRGNLPWFWVQTCGWSPRTPPHSYTRLSEKHDPYIYFPYRKLTPFIYYFTHSYTVLVKKIPHWYTLMWKWYPFICLEAWKVYTFQPNICIYLYYGSYPHVQKPRPLNKYRLFNGVPWDMVPIDHTEVEGEEAVNRHCIVHIEHSLLYHPTEYRNYRRINVHAHLSIVFNCHDVIKICGQLWSEEQP